MDKRRTKLINLLEEVFASSADFEIQIGIHNILYLDIYIYLADLKPHMLTILRDLGFTGRCEDAKTLVFSLSFDGYKDAYDRFKESYDTFMDLVSIK